MLIMQESRLSSQWLDNRDSDLVVLSMRLGACQGLDHACTYLLGHEMYHEKIRH